MPSKAVRRSPEDILAACIDALNGRIPDAKITVPKGMKYLEVSLPYGSIPGGDKYLIRPKRDGQQVRVTSENVSCAEDVKPESVYDAIIQLMRRE